MSTRNTQERRQALRVSPDVQAWLQVESSVDMRQRQSWIDDDGALHLGRLYHVRASQLIPRIMWQTHKASWPDVPAGIGRAAASWYRLNPEYEYVYYSDAAMRKFVRREGWRVSGFERAFESVSTGAGRCDLWRYLLVYLRGGVYADMDSKLWRPLRSFVGASDEAVSGVGHDEHGLEQWVLLYRRSHPLLRRALELAVRNVLHADGRRSTIVETGPSLLYQATLQVLRLPPGFRFQSSSQRSRWCSIDGRNATAAEDGCVTVLPGWYDCARHSKYCGNAVSTLGGNAQGKYAPQSEYEAELAAMNASYYAEAQPLAPRNGRAVPKTAAHRRRRDVRRRRSPLRPFHRGFSPPRLLSTAESPSLLHARCHHPRHAWCRRSTVGPQAAGRTQVPRRLAQRREVGVQTRLALTSPHRQCLSGLYGGRPASDSLP